MSQDRKPDTASEHGARSCPMHRKSRLGLAAATLLGLGALLGALITTAVAVGAHDGGMRGWRHGYHGAASIEQARERALDKAAWLLATVDATPDQEQRVSEVVTRLVETLYPLRDAHRAHRRELIAELARPQLDPAALERIRGDALVLADTASRELARALSEVSEILDPAQRQTLVDLATRHHH